MTLEKFIQENYGGNNAAFGAANGISRQAVGQMVKKGIYYVYDGQLMISRRKVSDIILKAEGF